MESRDEVAAADGAMVGGGLGVPLGEEVAGTDGEAEAAVGVADLEDGAGFDFALRDEEFEALVLALNDGEQGDGALLDAHLDGEASAHFAVEDFEGTDFRQAFGDGGMAGAVVSHKDDVVGEVDGVVLGEGAAGAEGVEDLHGENVFDLVLAGGGDAARGEHGGAKDDGGDSVFVRRAGCAFVEVGECAELILLNELVERDGGTGGDVELGRRAIGLDVEGLREGCELGGDGGVGDGEAQGGEFVDFEGFDVRAEDGGDRGEVGGDVQHTGVVVAHEAEAGVGEGVGDAGSGDPGVDLLPAGGIVRAGVAEDSVDLVEGDSGALEDVGELGHGAGGAVGEPISRHAGAIGESVEGSVVECGCGLEIKDQHGDFGAADDGQYCRRERVGGDVEDEQVDVFAACGVTDFDGALGGVDETEVDDSVGGGCEAIGHGLDVGLETGFETGELGPVGGEADSEETDAEVRDGAHAKTPALLEWRGVEGLKGDGAEHAGW